MKISVFADPHLASPRKGEGLGRCFGLDSASHAMPLLPLVGGGWVGVVSATSPSLISLVPGACA